MPSKRYQSIPLLPCYLAVALALAPRCLIADETPVAASEVASTSAECSLGNRECVHPRQASSLLQRYTNSYEVISNIGSSVSDADEHGLTQRSRQPGQEANKQAAQKAVPDQKAAKLLHGKVAGLQQNQSTKKYQGAAVAAKAHAPLPAAPQAAALRETAAKQTIVEGTATASKQTIASATMVVGSALLALGFLLPSEKGERVAEDGSRSMLLDNAKVVAQFLVIYIHLFYYNLIHSWEPQSTGSYDDWQTWLSGSSDLLRPLLAGFSAVSIPMLCFISGILSQGPPTQKRLRRFIERTVVPALLWVYFVKPVILETMMDLRPQAAGDRLKAMLRLQSFHEEWYLQALVLWRGSTFLLWSHLQPAVALLAMLALSSAAGYFNLNGPLWYLKLDDAMGFLPYFAIGYVFPYDLAWRFTERMHIPRMLALGFAILWVFALIPLAGALPDGHGNYNFGLAGPTFNNIQALDYSLYWTRRLARVVLEMPPTLLIFFYVIPRCETCLSWVGQHIIYPYLFHQVGNYWRNQLVQKVMPPRLESTESHVAVLILHAPYVVLLLVVFASRPWRMLFSWCFEPRWVRSLLKEEQDVSRHAEASVEKPWPESRTHAAQQAVPQATLALTPATLAQMQDVPLRASPGDDVVSNKSTPELLPSRRVARSSRWQSTGYEIPWQCQARKYYMWLLPIFGMMLLSAALPFWMCVFYLPGWEVLLKVVDGFPIAFAIPIFFVALTGTAVNYVWHFMRLHGTEEEPELSTAEPLVHAIVVCAYKEPLDVLRRTMDSIVSQRGIHRRPIVVFAAEERDDTAETAFNELSKTVGDHFDMFLLTKHPLVEFETIGKSSNENFAVQELYKRLAEEEHRDPFEVLVTIVDADSILSATYLAHTENIFRAQRDGRRLIYSGPLSVHRNFSDAGLLTQCYELNRCHADTFHDPFSIYQPQSNYSLTLGFAQELGFWTPDVMPEDIHTANKARVNNFGSRTTVPIPSIICNDLVVQFGDRYIQAKRHQMGSITEFAWAMALFFESRTSFPGWWAVFNVEAGRDGSFLDIAKSIVGYGCKFTTSYMISSHWSMLHWRSRLYLGFVFACMVWRWLWFWIGELFLWQTLLLQFPVKRPSVARWVLIVCTMPFFLLAGDMIFYLGATIQCLFRITFIGELSYVCAPKGDAAGNGKAESASASAVPTTGKQSKSCH